MKQKNLGFQFTTVSEKAEKRESVKINPDSEMIKAFGREYLSENQSALLGEKLRKGGELGLENDDSDDGLELTFLVRI